MLATIGVALYNRPIKTKSMHWQKEKQPHRQKPQLPASTVFKCPPVLDTVTHQSMILYLISMQDCKVMK